jgi:hypothetical protein
MCLGLDMDEMRIQLKLSAQSALVGHVPACLRSASIDISDSKIIWKCVFDSEATSGDIELLSMAGTEIVSNFPAGFVIEEIFETVSFPQKVSNLKWLVYYRHEHNYYES